MAEDRFDVRGIYLKTVFFSRLFASTTLAEIQRGAALGSFWQVGGARFDLSRVAPALRARDVTL